MTVHECEKVRGPDRDEHGYIVATTSTQWTFAILSSGLVRNGDRAAVYSSNTTSTKSNANNTWIPRETGMKRVAPSSPGKDVYFENW